jgi:ribonuclease inhibitor
MKITLNGLKVTNKKELHDQLKEKLKFPDYYGNNLDALWDCLTGWIDLPITIEWEHYNESKKYLGQYAEEVLKTFKDAEDVLDDFKIEIR